MPKICEPCGFYSADNAPTNCPTCNGPLKFTLLPRRGQAAAPLADAAPDPARPSARNRREQTGFLEGLGISPKVVGIVAVVLVGIAGFAIRQYEKKQRLEKVRPGMHISEAAKLIDTGKGWHHPKVVRFRDRFAPDDTSTGTFTYQDGGNELVLHWENGIVTSVENNGRVASGGMRLSSTTVTDDGDDEVDEDN